MQPPPSAVSIGYTSPVRNMVCSGSATPRTFSRKTISLSRSIYMPGNISAPSLLAGEIQFATDDRRADVAGPPARRRPGDARERTRLLDDQTDGPSRLSGPHEDLKGKRIAISRFGAASHMRVLNILPRYGLSEKDVTFLQIGDTPARIVALSADSLTLRASRRRTTWRPSKPA